MIYLLVFCCKCKQTFVADDDHKILYYVQSLESNTFVVPNSIEIIYGKNQTDYCFKYVKDNLESLLFEPESNIIQIQSFAVSFCSHLSLIDFSHCTKLEYIGAAAFCANFELKIISLPSSVKRIDDGCFAGNNKLNKFEIPYDSQLEYIGSFAFGLTVVQGLFIPENLTFPIALVSDGILPDDVMATNYTHIIDFIFHPNSNYYSDGSFVYDKQNTTIFYSFGISDLSNILPTVTTLAETAFSHFTIEKLIIPDQIKFLRPYCFAFSRISSLTLSNSITEIPEYCFISMIVEEDIIIPSSVNIIKNNSLSRNMHLSSASFIILGNNITIFENNDLNQEIILFNEKLYGSLSKSYYFGLVMDVERKEVYSLIGTKWEVLKIPKTVKTIKENALRNFNGSYVFCEEGSELIAIENNAFDSCYNLKNIPNSSVIERIGSYAFRSCSKIKSVYLPLSFKHFESNSFYNCSIKCFSYANKTSAFALFLIDHGIPEDLIDRCYNFCQKCRHSYDFFADGDTVSLFFSTFCCLLIK